MNRKETAIVMETFGIKKSGSYLLNSEWIDLYGWYDFYFHSNQEYIVVPLYSQTNLNNMTKYCNDEKYGITIDENKDYKITKIEGLLVLMLEIIDEYQVAAGLQATYVANYDKYLKMIEEKLQEIKKETPIEGKTLSLKIEE
jgi:hypothetical protein